MVKPTKLYALLLQSTSRSIAYRDFIALIGAFGFVHERTKGSHQSYTHPESKRPLVVQPKGKEAKRYQVPELLDMIEEYGLTLDE